MDQDLKKLMESSEFKRYHQAVKNPPFNLFDVLRHADYEIRHSNVLEWLLDPGGTHGAGRIAGADSRRHRLRSNTDGQRCRRARIAGADLRRHRLQHHRKAEARRHQARAPPTIHPAVAGRFTAPRVVTSSPSAAGSALGYRTPQTSTDGRSLRLVSCCSEPGKPDPHRSVATAAATAPSP